MGERVAYHSSPPERGDETLKGPNILWAQWEGGEQKMVMVEN